MSDNVTTISPYDDIPVWLADHTLNGETIRLFVDGEDTPISTTGTFEPYAGQRLWYYLNRQNTDEEERQIREDSGFEISSTDTGSTISLAEDDLDDDDEVDRNEKGYLTVLELD
ncbi:hypothetical protein GGH12_003341 [Coemansia sp. RSA 1822]|nr:hypothetical protein LPJ76_003107 [Coemansia sp. RSA 638]KAJ2122889.1 hypothetical protein IW147_003055 [Coemansia sp. RSA 720]KAJ2545272.1 hypothetical protein GGF49_000506 [Coemansia sp. RSA 1853]KAJ2562287.1 hypothetical protein GGH12_003341 [Coemansia sp. RSA 1822]